jgi:hypothetical protein
MACLGSKSDNKNRFKDAKDPAPKWFQWGGGREQTHGQSELLFGDGVQVPRGYSSQATHENEVVGGAHRWMTGGVEFDELGYPLDPQNDGEDVEGEDGEQQSEQPDEGENAEEDGMDESDVPTMNGKTHHKVNPAIPKTPTMHAPPAKYDAFRRSTVGGVVNPLSRTGASKEFFQSGARQGTAGIPRAPIHGANSTTTNRETTSGNNGVGQGFFKVDKTVRENQAGRKEKGRAGAVEYPGGKNCTCYLCTGDTK